MNEALPDVSALEAEKDKLLKQITNPKRMDEPMTAEYNRVEELNAEIAKGHDYHFVGKIGQFCPIKPGCGGGELVRESIDKNGSVKYSSATGAKGYRWLESETVKILNKQDDIDRSYYDSLVDAAVETISKSGDFERFAADEPYTGSPGIDYPPDDDVLPWYDDEELKVVLAAKMDEQDELFSKR